MDERWSDTGFRLKPLILPLEHLNWQSYLKLKRSLVILFAIIVLSAVFMVSQETQIHYPPTLQPKPQLRLSGPSTVGINEKAVFAITCNEVAVEDAFVNVGNWTEKTDANGTVAFRFSSVGSYVVNASKEGYVSVSLAVNVVAISIRGFFAGRVDPSFSQSLQEAKEIGANYAQIVYWVEVLKNGSILPDQYCPNGWSKKATIDRILRTHDAGLKVYLQIYPEFYGTFGAHAGELEMGPVTDQSLFMEDMEKVALEWAKIGGDLHLELFSPACELNVFLSWDNNMKWHREILPKLREVYHGEIVQKGELVWEKYKLYPKGDLSLYDHYADWDYVNSDIFESVNSTQSFEDYRAYVNTTIHNLLLLKEKHNAKGILLGEIGIPESERAIFHFRTLHGLNLEEYRFMFWKILFEEAIGKVDGFFFWGWDEYPSASELIKSYYKGLGENYLNQVTFRFKDGASEALSKARIGLKALYNYSYHLGERNEKILLKAEEALKVAEYIVAKYWANKVNNVVEDLGPLGIVIDGYSDDWASRFAALTIDQAGDVTIKGEDLKALYLANDEENLYFMIQFSDKPEADVVLFFDIAGLNRTFDGIWDYHVRASPRHGAFLAKTIRSDYHEYITDLKFACDEVMEFKIPLKLMGNPTAVKMQVASWSDEKNNMSDKMIDFNWIAYTIKE